MICTKGQPLTRTLSPTMLSCRYCYKAVRRPDNSKLKIPVEIKPGPSLKELIYSKIKLVGPISVADYFNLVVSNPTSGYYLKKELIGEKGDFITSPEISQLFGEMIGIWFINETQKMTTDVPLQIVELGPGKGTLLVDLLRTVNRFRSNIKYVSVHLVEISQTHQSIQAMKLCITHKPVMGQPYYYEGEAASGCRIYWYKSINDVPKGFSWYIAHEFLDALPIHKFKKTDKGWREILIDLDRKNKLCYRISKEPTKAVNYYIRPPLDARKTDDLEVCPNALVIMRTLSQRIDEYGGIGLIADYGHEGEKGDTFRAFRSHKLVDPLSDPGTADLTADVDFSQLRLAAAGGEHDENASIVYGPVTQKDFLERCETRVRLKVLMDGSTDKQQIHNLESNYNMLVDPKQMGVRFKFLSLYPTSVLDILDRKPPLGFTPV